MDTESMPDIEPFDGLEIALQRIAKESQEKTGILNLGGLGLTELPKELFELRHLRILSLGNNHYDESGTPEYQYIESNRRTVLETTRFQFANLAILEILDLKSCVVSVLGPLSGLTSLSSLDCWNTQVSDLGPLSGSTSLSSLDCSYTQVSDLGPLSGLTNLSSLDCSDTQVSDLDRFAAEAEKISASILQLEQLPRKLIAKPSLEELVLHETTIPGIPPEVLSKSRGENGLPRLRAHLADLEQGAAAAHDIKLIIIGNGRIGKTQIARRLLGLKPESEPDSTHGISISSMDIESTDPGQPNTRVHLWDFGGQDIYHGTHALFMRTNAIFLLVWTNRSEESAEHEYRGMTFRNFKLAYWLEHIGHLADYQQPVLVIQNQCDSPQDESIPQMPKEIAAKFSHLQFRAYSALRNRGRAGLDQAIQEAIGETIQRRGAIFIGQGRAKVKLRLDAIREEDQSRPPAERRYRTISQEFFRSLCQEAGNISSVNYFLEYLHDCGLVFYRPGMFDDQIVLDQAWALQAIYTVLDRGGPYKALQSLKGRFSRSILAASVWQSYSEQEQNVFLSMMQSCGVCFIHREANDKLGIEAEYVAPDLLPDRESVRFAIASQWEHPGDTCRIECQYSYHDLSLTRSIVAEIGKRAKDSAIYWRYGACGYDLESRSHFLIEQHSTASLGSRITIESKGPAASSLAVELRELVERSNSQYGMRQVVWTGDVASLRSHDRTDHNDFRHEASFETFPVKSDETMPRLRLGYESKESAHEHFVSYAWGDDTPQGLERTKAIEELCEKAANAGIKIVRDSTHMQIGDRISGFMERIGSGQRVFVILSKKYLESEFCMYELWSIWKNCSENPDRFLSKIRVYKLPDARISKTVERLQCASYWVEQKNAIDELVRKHSLEIVGGTDLQKYHCMLAFASHTSEMLSLISDVLKTSDFDALLAQGFGEQE